MTPKEKAEELLKKYINLTDDCDCLEYMCVCFSMYDYKAKQCALIAVEEILQIDCHDMSEEHFDNHIEYWVAVEKKIENYEL